VHTPLTCLGVIAGGGTTGVWRECSHGGRRVLSGQGMLWQLILLVRIRSDWNDRQGRLSSEFGWWKHRLASLFSDILGLLLSFLFDLASLLIFLLKGGLDRGLHDLLQTSIDLATTVDLQTAVSLGNEVPEEDKV
jgi:hypothetical protein